MKRYDFITDRTMADVEKARQIILDTVQKKQTLTSAEQTTISRGVLGVDDLNFIEETMSSILYQFRDTFGYYNTDIETKSWGDNDVFFDSDFSRILENLRTLLDNTPTTADRKVPLKEYHYEVFNDIETLLQELQSGWQRLEDGELFCGDDIITGVRNLC